MGYDIFLTNLIACGKQKSNFNLEPFHSILIANFHWTVT